MMSIAVCVGCGCTDLRACHDKKTGQPCHWLVVDYEAGKGVCSVCEEHLHLERWGQQIGLAVILAPSVIPAFKTTSPEQANAIFANCNQAIKLRIAQPSAVQPAPRAVYLPVAIERMTDDEAQRRLAEVRVALASPEHYQATPSRNYGNLDPLDNMAAWLQPCRACGARPGLFFDVPQADHMRGKGRSKRWFARCGCGALGLAVRLKHEAVGEWNRSGLAKPMLWAEFPFFNVANLSPPEALRKLTAIKADLDLRLREAYLRLKLHDPDPPGLYYVNSLGAYRDWALYGQWLLKMLPTSDSWAESS